MIEKPISRAELLTQIKRFVIADAVGVTALRGQHKGTREVVLQFPKEKELDPASIPSGRAQFEGWLDSQTNRLRQRLPKKRKDRDRLWGVARKALNLYLRSCLYNHYLRREHGLRRIQTLLEVPLDSVVAGQLRKLDKTRVLPLWAGLKGLTAEESRKFQQHARKLAEKRMLPAPVLLDNFLWLR